VAHRLLVHCGRQLAAAAWSAETAIVKLSFNHEPGEDRGHERGFCDVYRIPDPGRALSLRLLRNKQRSSPGSNPLLRLATAMAVRDPLLLSASPTPPVAP
jgi:hypothetical protein